MHQETVVVERIPDHVEGDGHVPGPWLRISGDGIDFTAGITYDECHYIGRKIASIALDGGTTDRLTPTVPGLTESLWRLLEEYQSLNGPAMENRCRELSLAITKIEEAIHWLHAIKR